MNAAEYSGNALAVAEDLAALGYDCIPVAPGSKDMISGLTGWQKRPPAELWRSAPPDCNLAVRHGGELRLASVEVEHASTPEQAANVTRYLAGLGLYPDGCPVVNSARGFPRFFMRLLDAPATGNSRKMGADFGSGEFRYGPGAYSLIPPSIVDNRPYSLGAGDWRQLPPVYLADVAPLLKSARPQDAPAEVTAGPLSPLAQALADGENVLPADVRGRLHGRGGSDYPSVDDYTTVYRLAALGIDADTTLALMFANPGYGHFSDLAAKNHAAAVRWLTDAHAKATAYIAQHGADVSSRLARLIEQTEAQPWKGRTGATDRAVYLAHLRIAHDANTPIWAGASRRLADMVNVSRMTATNATHRLIESGKLALHKLPTAQLAAEYTLPTDNSAHTLPLLYGSTERSGKVCAGIAAEDNQDQAQNQQDNTPQRPPETEAGREQRILGHDLFCWQGLGKAAGLVFAALLDEPGTVAELATRTGRHPSTVKRVLGCMSAITNGASEYALVEESEPGAWEVVDTPDLDKAARLLGVAGIGDKRRAKHEAERQRHAQALEPYKNGAPIPHPSQNRGERMTPDEVDRKARQKTHTELVGTPEADEFRLQAEAML